jgi:hypothetical protein
MFRRVAIIRCVVDILSVKFLNENAPPPFFINLGSYTNSKMFQ